MRKLTKNAASTVAVTTDLDKSTGTVYYDYLVKGKTYTSSERNSEGVKIPGGKYLLIYDKTDPKLSLIIYNTSLDKHKLGDKLDPFINLDKADFHFWHQF
jgi:hypothetical protein